MTKDQVLKSFKGVRWKWTGDQDGAWTCKVKMHGYYLSIYAFECHDTTNDLELEGSDVAFIFNVEFSVNGKDWTRLGGGISGTVDSKLQPSFRNDEEFDAWRDELYETLSNIWRDLDISDLNYWIEKEKVYGY